MPIRINLLAEAQAAEEMRRRDPIKRTIYAGIALVVLMIAWIAVTQMNVSAARHELNALDTRLKQVDESSKTIRSKQLLAAEIDGKMNALARYSTNRFFWGTFLDAIQHVAVDKIRLMEIRAEQRYAGGDVNKFFITNVTVKYNPPPGWWKFWAGDGGPTVETLVSNSIPAITNAAPFTTNVVTYSTKSTLVNTNLIQDLVTARLEFSNVPWAMEVATIEIRGRDYGTPPGAAIDEFARRINNSPYFKELIEPGQGFRFTERPPQPRPDPQDPLNPNALFVPFTIELRLEERVLTND